MPRLLWWGKGDIAYSRNRLLRKLLTELNYQVADFVPQLSQTAALEARLRCLRLPDLVWVPCFRQRDIKAAAAYARRNNVPLVIDPLISAYDKQVYERKKFSPASPKAKKLLDWETQLFGLADLVLADTREHAQYFRDTLSVKEERLAVVPVGADEDLFHPAHTHRYHPGIEALFFGSFISLQGPETIAHAVTLYRGPPVIWHFLGAGPLLESCKERLQGRSDVQFSGWVAYEKLPLAIHEADIVLGIFGDSSKAGRVIPNKVYQALACGKPVITRASPAYPAGLEKITESGIVLVPPANPAALAQAVSTLASQPEKLKAMGLAARQVFENHFSEAALKKALRGALENLAVRTRRMA